MHQCHTDRRKEHVIVRRSGGAVLATQVQARHYPNDPTLDGPWSCRGWFRVALFVILKISPKRYALYKLAIVQKWEWDQWRVSFNNPKQD
eukprot:scaffold1982_cov93-Amphora_coffeaeformis.AAC.61